MIAADFSFIRLIRYAISYAMLAVAVSYSGTILSGEKWSIKRYFICYSLNAICIIGNIVSDDSHRVLPLLSILCQVVFYRVFCGARTEASHKAKSREIRI